MMRPQCSVIISMENYTLVEGELFGGGEAEGGGEWYKYKTGLLIDNFSLKAIRPDFEFVVFLTLT